MSDGEETYEQQPHAPGDTVPGGLDGVKGDETSDASGEQHADAAAADIAPSAEGVVALAAGVNDETSEIAGAPDDEAAEDLRPITTEQEAELRNIIEALIFASDEPISTKFLRQIIDDVNKDRVEDNRVRATTESIKRVVAAINYDYSDRAFHITPIAGGFVFATRAKYSAFVGKLAKEKARRKLSATAIESLAIIAYKQPITKSEVEFIRGVNADYIIKTLLEKNLITITGRASTPGRPLLYGTTDEFLKHFGLNEITDLPKPREIEELIGETELEVEKRLLAEQQELEFKDELSQKLEGGQKPSGSRAPLRQTSSRVPLPPAAGTPTPDVEVPAAVEQPADVPSPEPAAVGVADEAPGIVESVEHAAETTEDEAEAVHEAPAEEENAPLPTVEVEDTVDAVSDQMRDEEVADADAIGDDMGEERIHPVLVSTEEDAAVITPPSMGPIEPVADDAIDTETEDDEQLIEQPAITETLDDEKTDVEGSAEIADIVEEEEHVEAAATPDVTEVIEEAAPPVTEVIEEAAPLVTEETVDEPALPETVDVVEDDAAAAPDAGEAGTEPTPEKGWSKWKTKIKTFFKKLFE